MWIIKEHVVTIVNVLKEEPFKPSESCEVIIRQKYDKIIRKYALCYYGLVQVTVICIILNAIFMDFMKRNLTFKAWVPFDYTSPIIFFFVFTHQIIGMSICAIVNVACDSLISGLLQEICCQLEILEYRLKISYDQHSLYNCIRHHDRIYENNMRRYLIIVLMSITSIVMMSVSTDFMKRNLTYKAWVPFDYSSPAIYFIVYIHQLIAMSTSGIVNVACESLLCGFLLYAYTVNNMFAKIIAIQFAVSMLVVCSNLYRIAMARDYISFISLIMYTSAILVQIFIYCWFGNEVKLKSLQLINNIYDIEWLALSNSNKKDLLLIMKRAMTPIEFTSGYIITMNLESFVALLKMSYSIFNLLHQTND
ncbi:Odorant receptor 2a [Trachymyrmex septentrionalis]|uniref:Odorant receptor n=1 Tax=Trachymyrmex septentrionalis TaxID=34720 RepID=A0A195FQL1_9HYME|nr:Odorant receptor 2a [Trachymyrmex septentrionalis]